MNRLDLSSNRQTIQQQGLSTPAAASPRAGQRVRVAGREEVFVILRVDKTRHLADLLRQGKVHKVEAGVPLTLLEVVPHSEPMDDLNLTERAS